MALEIGILDMAVIISRNIIIRRSITDGARGHAAWEAGHGWPGQEAALHIRQA